MTARLLALLIVILGFAAPTMAADRLVTVVGEGAVRAAPDRATLSVTSNAQAPTAKAAMAVVADKARAVVNALKAAGLTDKNLQTSRVSLHPVHARRKPGEDTLPAVAGYRAMVQTHVTINDVNAVGDVLDAVVGAGVDGLGAIGFAVAEPRALQDKARALAVQDAKRVAGLLAAEAGAKLGGVVSIEETAGGPPVGLKAMAFAAEASVPVTPGEISVTTRLRVQFALTD